MSQKWMLLWKSACTILPMPYDKIMWILHMRRRLRGYTVVLNEQDKSLDVRATNDLSFFFLRLYVWQDYIFPTEKVLYFTNILK